MDDAGGDVEVADLQGGGLAPAGAGDEQDDQQRLVRLGYGCVEARPLGSAEDAALLLDVVVGQVGADEAAALREALAKLEENEAATKPPGDTDR